MLLDRGGSISAEGRYSPSNKCVIVQSLGLMRPTNKNAFYYLLRDNTYIHNTVTMNYHFPVVFFLKKN